MSDTIDDYKALAEMRKQERAERRAAAEAKLQGLNYSVHNDGAHIVIWEGGAIFDFWPGTDRWRMRNFKGQFGVDNLLAAIRQRKIVALDLSKIEARVVAQMVDAGTLASKPFSGDPSTLRVMIGMTETCGKPLDLQYRGTGREQPTCGTFQALVPPWEDIPSNPDEDKAYVDGMEKAYPHLKGEDDEH